MQRKTTILLVGALVAILAIGLIAPAVSADGNDDTLTTEDGDAQNATEVQAQYMADWMETRMGPDGVESFEHQTGTTVDEVAYALVENMRPVNSTWAASPESPQYGPGTGYGYQAPGGYGPMMPHGGYGPMMPHGGYGPMAPGGNGYAPGPWGADNPGTGFGPNDGAGSGGYWNGGFGSSGFGSGGFGSGGYGPGMGGPGMGGGMGGGW